MTVLIASELTEADVALLTRPESPALRLGGLRMLARASGLAETLSDAARSAASAPRAAVPFARLRGRPQGWPGVSHDRPGALRAS